MSTLRWSARSTARLEEVVISLLVNRVPQRRQKTARIVVIAGLLLSVSCGVQSKSKGTAEDRRDEQPDASPGGPESVPLNALGEELTKTFCAVEAKCRAPTQRDNITTDAICEAFYRPLLEGLLSLLPRSVAQGRVFYDPIEVKKCLTEAGELPCGGFVVEHLRQCLTGLRGNVAVGGECQSDFECPASASCRSTGVCMGVCTANATEGQACGDSEPCAGEARCVSKVCRVPGVLGQSCGEGEPLCAAGLWCLRDTASDKPGTCVRYDALFTQQEGESCDWIAGQLCIDDLVCATVSGSLSKGDAVSRCEKPSTSGGPCYFAAPRQCPSGEYCDAAMGLQGTCRPLRKQNETCGTSEGALAPCEPPLACARNASDTVVCVPYAHLGEACRVDEQCETQHCQAGVCVSALGCQE